MKTGGKYRIGLEASSALSHKVSGIERYIRELVFALADLAGFEPDLEIGLCYKGSRIRKKGCRPELPLGYRWYWPIPGFSAGRYDLVHCLDTGLPWFQPTGTVCTVHDLFSIVVDGYSTPRFRERKVRAYHRIVQCCNAIIVPSSATKLDLIDHLDCPEDRIFVVPHGVSPLFFQDSAKSISKNRENLPAEPYILCFGPQKRKNLGKVLGAFAASRLFESHMLLVIGSLDQDAIVFLRHHGLENRVVSMSGVKDDRMPALYMGASLLCFPSVYEGFGLPVLEAMASGTPVVTSRTSATGEVGSEHAVLVNPESVPDIACGMKEALNLNNSRLVRAKEYAQSFTWRETAKATLSVYKKILNL